jgi:hypothetical protein
MSARWARRSERPTDPPQGFFQRPQYLNSRKVIGAQCRLILTDSEIYDERHHQAGTGVNVCAPAVWSDEPLQYSAHASADNRMTNFLFVIGLGARIPARTSGIRRTSKQLISATLAGLEKHNVSLTG